MAELEIFLQIFSYFFRAMNSYKYTKIVYFPLPSQTKFCVLAQLYSSGNFQVPIPILFNAEVLSHFPTFL